MQLLWHVVQAAVDPDTGGVVINRRLQQPSNSGPDVIPFLQAQAAQKPQGQQAAADQQASMGTQAFLLLIAAPQAG